MKLIYLAHPYGGKMENIARSIDLASKLTLEYPNFHIFNAVKYFSQFKDVFSEDDIAQRYLDMITRCDELWLAPGWETSKGCKAELLEIQRVGKPVRYLKEKRNHES